MSNNNSDNDEYNSAENSDPSTPPELAVHLPPAPVTNPFAPPVFGAPAALSLKPSSLLRSVVFIY